MFQLTARGILLDIEGTTSSISFVHDEMFPFARRQLKGFLESNWNSESVRQSLDLLAKDHQQPSTDEWLGKNWLSENSASAQQTAIGAVNKLMDGDVKATGLKHLQGLIWKDGFHSGDLVAHLYPDAEPAIRGWVEQGLDVRIYSSGSVGAQKLFFGHTIAGDLLSLFSGHYDTTTGPKKDAASYTTIATEFKLPAREIVFISDVPAELDAAKTAGLQTVLSIRDGNATVDNLDDYQSVQSFAELDVSLFS